LFYTLQSAYNLPLEIVLFKDTTFQVAWGQSRR